jgi:hypothetical protein
VSGIAERMERKAELTVFDDLNLAATSGSRITATASFVNSPANRFGLDRL